MKHFLILLIVTVISLSSCTHTSISVITPPTPTRTSYMSTGTITGPDLGMTICSGGYFITISGVTTITRFNTLPAGTGIDLTTATFPINVRLNWHMLNPSCGIIAIDALERVY